MANILIIGSINIDLVINTKILPKLGETIHGEKFMTSFGGKGANQATAVAKVNGGAKMIGAVGNDSFGKDLVANLNANGVNTDGVEIADTNSGVAVITVCNGDNHIILDMGANGCVTKEVIDKNIDLVKEADIVIFQLEIPVETIIYAAGKAKEFGAKVLLNPAPAAPIPNELLELTDIIIPNEHEAAAVTGEQDLEKALAILSDNGKRTVVITLGGDGCMYMEDGEVKKMPAIETKVVDTTAAGDSFIGGFCAMLSQGKSVTEAVSYGTKVSSITVSRPGAANSIPTKEEIEKIYG